MGVSIYEFKSPFFWTPTTSQLPSLIQNNRDDFNNYFPANSSLNITTVTNPTYIIPCFATNIIIDFGGGGGGGGGAYRPDGGAALFCAGGGGAGGTAARLSIKSGSGAISSNTFQFLGSLEFSIGLGGIGGGDGGIDAENGGSTVIGVKSRYPSSIADTIGIVYGGGGGFSAIASPSTFEIGAGGSPNNTPPLANYYSLGGSGASAGLFFSGGGGGGAGVFNPGGNANGVSAGAGGAGDNVNGGNGGSGRTTAGFGLIGAVYGGGGSGGYINSGSGEFTRNGGSGANGYFKMYYDENIVQYLFVNNNAFADPPIMETYTWTVPAGVSRVGIECWGGGGQGGEGEDNGLQRGEGGGGAGGSYARRILTVSAGDQLTLEIPSYSGYANEGAATGNQGGTATVTLNNNTIVCRAIGGAGGGRGIGNVMGVGGAGSTVGCVGDIAVPGGDGATAVDFPNRSGAGGGGASALGPGNSATADPTYLPGAHKPQFGGKGGNTLNVDGNGYDGYDFGGGGGGGFSQTIGNPRAGGVGGRGLIQLTIKYDNSINFFPFFNPA